MIELTKCRAGFYYYFTATAQYVVKKEGNQWAFYKTVKGEIYGEALIVARTLTLLKEALINFVDSEIDTQDTNQETSQTTHSEQNDHSSEHLEWSDFHQAYLSVATGEVIISLEHNEPKIVEVQQLTSNSVEDQITQNFNDNDPDGDDIYYPSEIDSPDPDFDHDTPEVDYPDYQLLLGKFKEENPHFTVLESKFFTVPYWHLTEQKLLIFGYGGEGNKWNVFSVISFTTNRTNHIFDGNYQQSKLIYQEYCGNTAKFEVIPPRAKDPILERYKQELTPDYRVFTRKQLALF